MEERKSIKSLDYYKNSNIRARMMEFLGGFNSRLPTAVYITRCDIPPIEIQDIRSPDDIDYYLHTGLDICRSLWDNDYLVVDIDIEYVNYDFPAEAYLHPERTFSIQKPVHSVIEETLLQYNLIALQLLSGRGQHFIWQISKTSQAYELLQKIGRLSSDMISYYKNKKGPNGEVINESLGKAFAGLALVMEYLACRIRQEAAPLSGIPVELTAVEVSPQERGREMISIDITEYGDPLNTRMIRLPFSVYLKPWNKYGVLNENIRDMIPFIFMIPRGDLEIDRAIRMMRDEKKSASLAITSSARIPDQSDFMVSLIEEYNDSALADFHSRFYSQKHDTPDMWPDTYDRFTLEDVPECIQSILRHPNDLLLKPTGIRYVVRSLLALGWHPRHIAGLIRSKYERDYGWGSHWYYYNASYRADFYVRVFAGQIATGIDDLEDFNCQSLKEKNLCNSENHNCEMESLRTELLKRTKL